MTTEFFLGVLRAEDPHVQALVPIGESDHARLSESCAAVVRFVEQQSFSLVERNYDVLLRAIDRTRTEPLSPDQDQVREHFFEISFNVLDWLLAARMFLDHARYDLSSKRGKDSTALQEFDQLRRSEHAGHQGYRLMYELRDYCAHRGLPPLDLRANANRSGSQEFTIQLDPQSLLERYDWKKWTREDLSAMAGPVAFEELAEDYMGSLTRLARMAQRKPAPEVLGHARAVASAAHRVSNLEGFPTLFLIRSNDTTGVPEALSPLALPIAAAGRILKSFDDR